MSKIAFMTMDVESFFDTECIRNKNIPYNEEYSCEETIKDYLNLLNEYNIKGTFFTLETSLNKTKIFLKEAVNQGHEIALHGLNHDSPLSMDLNTFINNTKQAKEKLERELSIKIKGYRAPCFGINDELVNEIKNLDFSYDSSNLNFKKAMNSGCINLNGYKQKNDLTYENDNFYEFNPAISGLPVSGGGYIRLVPWFVMRWHVIRYIKKHNCYMFYVHPFEISNLKLPKYKELSFVERLFINRNRKKYLKMIRRIINLLIKNGFEFKTMYEYIKEQREN